jgi:hypothetical protein
MQSGHGHASWTCKCSMDLNILYIMDMGIRNGHLHAAWK